MLSFWRRIRALLVLVALGTSGCAINNQGPNCPQIAILNQAERITKFANPDDPTAQQIVFQAQITKISGSCVFNKLVTHADIDMNVGVTFARGPASPDGKINYNYFIVALDPNQKIVMRQEFVTEGKFELNEKMISAEENLGIHLPLPGADPASAYSIFVGFQLTPKELQYNRDHPVI